MASIQFINVDEITNRHRTPLTVADVDPAHAHRFTDSNMSFNKDLQLKGKYCYHPFNSVTIDTRGECYVCVCQAWLPISVGNILEFNSLTEIVQSPKAREIQASIIDGTYKYCDHTTCHLIKQNDLSNRISHKTDTVNWIVFAIDDSCNLSCPSCRTELIFFNKGEEFEHRMKISRHITKLIQEHHQFLKFTLSGDGDPFASHVYRNILENLQLTKDDQVEIEIVTNGILAKSHWDRMSGVHNHIIRFKISFDAGSEGVYTTTRRGGDWDKLIESSKYIINWKQKNYSDMKIVANFVVQANNYKDIHNYVKLTNNLGFDEISFQKVVDWSNWNIDGVNYFTNHAVWMESHPGYQELLTILNDPIMKDRKINLNNLLELQSKFNRSMRLAELVKLKNLVIKNLNSTALHTEISALVDKLYTINNDIAGYDTKTNRFNNSIENISQQATGLDNERDQLVSIIDADIASITKIYHKRGYVINGMYGSNRTDPIGEQQRILPLSDTTREIISAQIANYSSWEYPGLEIGPGEGVWTEQLVACDPLYLVDIHQEFLDKTLRKFNESYQKRLCSYLTDETTLSMLPQNQIGFVFSWNVFNYLTADLIDEYLSEIFNVLRPGGICMFSYNNAERFHSAEFVESGFMSYMPKTLLVDLIHKHGFNVVKLQDLQESVSWVEIQKPGVLTTIKAHQVLGAIIEK
jgi:organic radical activating enzyme/SAM-dependent methyltransferase